MAQNTINNVTINAASNNTVVTALTKEEITMKTKEELRVALEMVGVEMSNTQFKKTKKADLIAMLEQHNDVSKRVEVKKVEGTEMKNDYSETKWDKLVKAVAAEYVAQSLNVKWALFYKNTKSTTTKDDYLVKTKKLWGATSKVIKKMYGEKNCNVNNMQQALEAMIARGYLNYRKVTVLNNQVNIVYSASTNQMNAMYKLSK